MVFAHSSAAPISFAAIAPIDVRGYAFRDRSAARTENPPNPQLGALNLNRTQRALLALLAAVRTLRDGDDVQCLAFLAGEIGILRPSPFYFSRRSVAGVPAPWSLVLRDTLRALLETGLVSWESGALRVYPDLPLGALAEPGLHGSVSWLGVLSTRERHILAQATIELQRNGIGVLSRRADGPFGRALARALATDEGAAASERRLAAVRRQLSIA